MLQYFLRTLASAEGVGKAGHELAERDATLLLEVGLPLRGALVAFIAADVGARAAAQKDGGDEESEEGKSLHVGRCEWLVVGYRLQQEGGGERDAASL